MKNDKPDAATLTVKVFPPSGDPDAREFTWPKNWTVSEAARDAATSFGLTGGNPTLRNTGGEVLDRSKRLVAAGVRDGDELELVDAGGGV